MFCKKKKRQSVITPCKSPRKKSELLRTYLLLGCDSHLSSILPRSVDRAEKKKSISNFKVRKKSSSSLQTILEPPDHEKRIRAYSITRDGSKTIVDEMTNEDDNKPEDWDILLSQLFGDKVKVATVSKSGDKRKEKVYKNQSQKNQSMKTEESTNKKCNIFRLRIPKPEKSQTSVKCENVARQEQALSGATDHLNRREVTDTKPETVDKRNGDNNQNFVKEIEDGRNQKLNENIRYFFLSSPSSQTAHDTYSLHPHIPRGSYRNAKISHEDKEQSSNCHSSYKSAKNSNENKGQSSNCNSSYTSAKNSNDNKEKSSNNCPGIKWSPNNSKEQNNLSSKYDTAQHQQKKQKMRNVLSLNNMIALDEPVFHANDYAQTPNKYLQEVENMAQKLKTKWRSIPHLDESEEKSESKDRLRSTKDHVWEKDILNGRNSNETVKEKRYADKFRDPTAKILNNLKSLQDDFQSVSQALNEANADHDTGDSEPSRANKPSRAQPATYLPQYLPVYDSRTNYVILQQAPAPLQPFVHYSPDKSHETKKPPHCNDKPHENKRLPYYKDKSHETKQPNYCNDKSHETKQPLYCNDKSHETKKSLYCNDKSHETKQPLYCNDKSHENKRLPYYEDKYHEIKEPPLNKDKPQGTKRPISYSFGGRKSHKRQEQKQKANKVKQKTHEHNVSYWVETDPLMKSNAKNKAQTLLEPSNNVATTQTTESFQTARNTEACNPQLEPNDRYSGRDNVSDRSERLAPIAIPAGGPVHVIPLVPPKHTLPMHLPETKLPLPPGCYYLTSQGYLYPTYNPHTPNATSKAEYIVNSEFYHNPVYVPQSAHCGQQPHHSEGSVSDNQPPVYVIPATPKIFRRCPFQVKPQNTFFVHGIPIPDPDTEPGRDSTEWQDMDKSSDESVYLDSEETKEKSAQIEYLLENVKQIGQQYYEMSSKTMVPVLRLVQNQLICRFYNLRQYLNKTLQGYVDTYEHDDSRKGSEISFVSSADLRKMAKRPSRPVQSEESCRRSHCSRSRTCRCNLGQSSRVPLYHHSCCCQSRHTS